MGRTRLRLTAAHLSLLVCLAALLPLVPLGALPASAGPVAETAAQLPPTDLPEGLAVDGRSPPEDDLGQPPGTEPEHQHTEEEHRASVVRAPARSFIPSG